MMREYDAMAEPVPPTPAGAPNPDTLRDALKAFKKRLKLSKLDDESTLGRGPLSSGRSAGIVAITPPNQYPRAVWDELVAQGKLRYSGQGLYELVKSAH